MTRTLILGIPILVLAVVVQSTFFVILPLWEQIPQLLVLSAIAWGMIRGLSEGLAWGFLAGFLLDLFSVSPVGINSLAIMLVTTLAVFIVGTLPSRRFWIPAVIGGLCAILYLFITVALTFFTAFGSRTGFLPDIGLYFFVQSIFMLPIYWVLYWLNYFFPSLEPAS